MTINYENLTKAESLIIDWQYNRGKLGSFQESLVNALSIADSSNLNRLKKGFPEEAEAMHNFHHKSGYFAALEVKAGLLAPDWEDQYKARQLKIKVEADRKSVV